MSHVAVFVTTSSAEEAQRIARAVVDERLAACANVLGAVASRYWWQGQVEEASEVLLILKTRQDLLDALTARVRSMHSYTVPEVIGLPIVGGNPDYLAWIDESVEPTQPTPPTQPTQSPAASTDDS
ncbi:MAG: divalent-cation tolerance protein CutA [bacterium]